jgi:hypothetical protein
MPIFYFYLQFGIIHNLQIIYIFNLKQLVGNFFMLVLH